ncbi:hypothetical protein F4827_004077 [Paraburkholderia bannensis]|uniref:Uncharacterized protein n=1 Tax=Paraburkholderia bannensis TaxID=765414 RepID=A0A7W9WUX0_9BURK|nr:MULTISPECIES: hypothetical protein [Paraburkholderia]MBB3259203.1 hypothetical protein [Paraburkholderia sp. WP4_3_2]MBB6104218.1 hypothetical protein [Paraburkholderia bannensis]
MGCRTEIATHINHLVCDASPVPSLDLDVCCYRTVNAAIRRGKLAGIYRTGYGLAAVEAVEFRVFCSANVRQSAYLRPRRFVECQSMVKSRPSWGGSPPVNVEIRIFRVFTKRDLAQSSETGGATLQLA